MNTIPTEKDILAAHQRIEKWIIKTPVLQNDFINKLIDATVFFKCENLQKIGAFKVRGAFNTVLQLSDKEKKKWSNHPFFRKPCTSIGLSGKPTKYKSVHCYA